MGACTSSTSAAAAKVEASLARVFSPGEAKGGNAILPTKTAIVLIEYQNEFTTEGGKLSPAVKEVMNSTGMLQKSAEVVAVGRKAGCKIFHAGITFAEDGSDNPNKRLGILMGCFNDKLFTEGTWNADFCESMKPVSGDVLVTGKRGLDAFPGTDLESSLKAHGIETVVLAGFLTNCCVESTMRTAYEKGYNVVTLIDCTATTSQTGQAAATGETFSMFSQPLTAADFLGKLAACRPVAAVKGENPAAPAA
mmetsp:Transcript_72653/g.121203  ORF Transcript_72653/g.121203 Transcript_72653/m.121203 type:complete len:251 (-) Transcript_72653:178-930(-)